MYFGGGNMGVGKVIGMVDGGGLMYYVRLGVCVKYFNYWINIFILSRFIFMK